jgi:hypothetical protein
MWTLEEGIKTTQWLEERLSKIGFHCALTGGVLFKGKSEKDLDVVVYPHDRGGKSQPTRHEAWEKIREVLPPERSNICGGLSQIRDKKDVRFIECKGKRIDFFFLD